MRTKMLQRARLDERKCLKLTDAFGVGGVVTGERVELVEAELFESEYCKAWRAQIACETESTRATKLPAEQKRSRLNKIAYNLARWLPFGRRTPIAGVRLESKSDRICEDRTEMQEM